MIGKIERVENLKKKDAAAATYLRVVVLHGGRFKNLLLTDSDMTTVELRAEKNPEDCAWPSWWQKFIYWFLK